MIASGWTLVFKLRNNIPLEGDVELARRELCALIGTTVEPIDAEVLHTLSVQGWLLPKDVAIHREGTVGFRCQVDAPDLTRLFWRLSFCEQALAIAPTADASVFRSLPTRLTRVRTVNGRACAVFIPFSAVAEWSDVVARRAKSPKDATALLDFLVDALVAPTPAELSHNLRAIVCTKQTTGHLFHGLHVYKAKFFPRMARAFINLCEGTTVLDPFAGSGTALVEAAVMGAPSIGVDIDPLSVAIAQAKAQLLNDDGTVVEAIADVLGRLDGSDKGQVSLFEIAETPTACNLTPQFLRRRIPEPELREVEADVATILHALRSLPACSPLHIALSDALSRKFKFRFLGLGYGRFSLTIQPRRVRAMFVDNLHYLSRSLAVWEWLRAHTGVRPAPIRVLHGDARRLPLEDACVDCIVTSPPYMPASSGRENYLKSKAYAMTALGLIAPDAVDALEAEQIGSVQRAGESDDLPEDARAVVEWMQSDPTRCVKASATASYFVDLRESLREVRRVLKSGGKCAYVVARRHVFYRYQSREVVRIVESADLTAQLALQAGLRLLELVHVELQKQNTVARPRSLDAYYETIVLVQKDS
jgi:SAM-dependent methyltransferase